MVFQPKQNPWDLYITRPQLVIFLDFAGPWVPTDGPFLEEVPTAPRLDVFCWEVLASKIVK